MATTPTKPTDLSSQLLGLGSAGWPGKSASGSDSAGLGYEAEKTSHRDALQALLAFSALHQQVRRRRTLASRFNGFDAIAPAVAFESGELFVLDEVLQLVAERAVAITGADGLAIALAENNEIVLRASAGMIKPDVGARIERDSAFSGACFRTAQIVRCDDTEIDDRVNLQACRRLGARSMVAVPLCGRQRVIGLLEAFSAEPFGFNDSDVGSLELLAELVLGALKPEDEDRFAQSAEAASTSLGHAAYHPPQITRIEAPIEKLIPAQGPIRIEPPASEQVSGGIASSGPRMSEILASQRPTAPIVPTPAQTASISQLTQLSISSSVQVPLPQASAAPVTTEKRPPEAEDIRRIVAPIEAQVVSTIEPLTEVTESEDLAEESQSSRRSGWLFALACVVFAALFAAGLWWRLKTEQLGSAVIQPQKPALKPVVDGATVTPATTPATQPVSAPNAEPTASDAALSAPDDSTNRPATPQEMSKFPRVTGIRHWSSADSTSVVLDLEDQVQYESNRLNNPERTYFDLRDTVLAPELAGKTIEVGDAFVSRIRVAQPSPGMTRVVLETRGNSKVTVSLEPNPYRLVMHVSRTGANPKGAVNLFPETSSGEKMAIIVPPPTKEDLQLRARVPKLRIVVDAGHGGWDLGTVGKRGLLEKDLVLEVAQRLGKLLESRLGSEVVYTRQDDNYIALDERAQLANQAQADLFVSVHANYSDLPSARGVETYYTNFFSTPGARTGEAHVTSASASSTTLSPAELHEKIEQSRRLAASVQRSLYGMLSVKNSGLRDRGVKEAGFVVLTETAMPGILAEVSFVSSPTDEQKLRSDGYREQIAEALYKGIARYAASSRGVKVASAK